MKAIKQQFSVVLLVMLYRVVLSFEYVGEILKCDHPNKRTEQFFPGVLFVTLYNVILTFESVVLV